MPHVDHEDRKAYARKRYRERQIAAKGFVRQNCPDPSVHARLEFWSCYCGDCIVWTGQISKDGYGQIQVNSKKVPAHRVAYELAHGLIPEGLEPDHLCRNRACINVAHLEAVTHAKNVLRGASPVVTKKRFSEQTHCKNGHEFTSDNTRMSEVRGYRRRTCKACEKAKDQRRASR